MGTAEPKVGMVGSGGVEEGEEGQLERGLERSACVGVRGGRDGGGEEAVGKRQKMGEKTGMGAKPGPTKCQGGSRHSPPSS